MQNLKVAIIDYQLSNLYSVKNACKFVGLSAEITSNPKDIESADALILPGVGAFGNAMQNLKELKLIDSILEQVALKKPLFGVCLGLQLLFERSEEFGNHKGLGLIKGSVVKFSSENKIKIPQIGWNKLHITKDDSHFNGIDNGAFMYFVHSYFVRPKDESVVLAKTTYEDIEYTSAISSDNIFAVQFHPEKSGEVGLKIYQNFAEIIRKK
jgi:imidazole glycerol-phosphate synthase subunit HisH